MKQFDNKKTEELLSNLTKDGVEVKDLSKLFCKKIIGVRIIARRGKMLTGINDLKTLGLDTYSKNKYVESFKKDNIYAGAFRLFDKNIISQFDNLLANVRQMIYRYSLTNEGTIYYMTLDDYKDFKKVFEEKYVESFKELKTDLIENLKLYKKNFEKKFTSWLKNTGLDSSEIKLIKQKYLSKFPLKDEIEKNCILDYYTIAYPVFNEVDIEGISGEVATDLLEDQNVSVIETFYSLIGNSLYNLYDITLKMIDTVEISTKDEESQMLKTSMSSRTKGLFKKTIEKIYNTNHLLKNDKIDCILYLLDRTFTDKLNKDGLPITNGEAVNISEKVLAVIYSYSKYLGVDYMLEKTIENSIYDVEEFELFEDIDLLNL